MDRALPAHVTRGALVALYIGTRVGLLPVEILSAAEPLCPSQCLCGACGAILMLLCFGDVGLAGFKTRANAFLLA